MSYPQSQPDSPAWAAGSLVTALTFVLTLVGTFSFVWELVEITPWLAIVLLLIIVGGSAPTAWRHRERPVLRWVIYGVIGGVATATVGLMLALLFMP